MAKCRDRRAIAVRDGHEAWRQRAHLITMAHPGDECFIVVETTKERPAVRTEIHFRAAVLAAVGGRDFTAVEIRHEIHPVAHAQYRRDLERGQLRRRDVVAVYGVWTAAENDSRRRLLTYPFSRSRRRVNLRVHARVAHHARNQL